PESTVDKSSASSPDPTAFTLTNTSLRPKSCSFKAFTIFSLAICFALGATASSKSRQIVSTLRLAPLESFLESEPGIYINALRGLLRADQDFIQKFKNKS